MVTKVSMPWAVSALAVLLPGLVLAAPQNMLQNAPPLAQAAHSQPTSSQSMSLRHAVHRVSLTAGVTGYYSRSGTGTLDVLQLPGGRIRFYLLALADTSAPGGPNTGEASGIVALHKGMAVYKPDASQSDDEPTDGKLILHFQGGRAIVSQQGNMPFFGMGVTAGGIYVRYSRKSPKFNKDGQAIK